MTREEIVKTILKMDPGLTPDDEAFKAQLVMLAALDQETLDVRKLAKFTGVSVGLVNKFAHNLRKNGVWKGRKIYADWFGENGGIEFNLDTCVAIGWMERSAA
jgi:hypothetical protein